MRKVVDKIKKLDKKGKVVFAVIFGSYDTDKYNPALSDIDIAVFYEGSKKERFDFRALLSGELGDRYDVHIFQDLPLHIKKEVISEGKVVFNRDMKKASEIYISTAREYGHFKRHLDRYYEKLKGDLVA